MPSLPFYIRNTTGELIAFAEIDRETTAKYEFTVKAKGDTIGEKRTRVAIQILDVNDNIPHFVSPAHVIAIDRLTTPGAVLAHFQAVDSDEGREGHISYSATGSELFAIDAESGKLSLSQSISPDQPNDVFNLTIMASDGGRPALKSTHNLQIEVFNSGVGHPQFKQREYMAEKVGKDAGAGAFVTQVLAGVGNFVYSIENPPAAKLFAIDEASGTITVGREPTASERGRNYSLTVVAREQEEQKGEDGVALARTTVYVHLEGNTPKAVEEPAAISEGKCDFEAKVYRASIMENTDGRHKLTTVKKNKYCKEKKVRYAIQDGHSGRSLMILI